MTYATKLVKNSVIAFGAAAAAMLWSGDIPTSERGSLVSTADARIGRPLTPFSYAGVARRTTRRAVAVGAVGTAAAVGAVGAATYGAAAVRATTVRATAVGAAAATTTVRAAAPYGCVRVIGPLGRAATVCR
jgi:hypothetical protein